MDVKLYTSTPMGQAVLRMLGKLELGYRSLNEDLKPGAVRIYIFGGAAVHLYTNARGSGDIDAEVSASHKLELSDLVASYEDEDGNEQILVWDSTFNPTLGPLHEDYTDDAVILTQNDEDIVWVYVVSPVDLAVSKLGRCVEHDLEDVGHLAKAGLITVASLEARANQAFVYAVGNEVSLRGNLKEALKVVRECSDD